MTGQSTSTGGGTSSGWRRAHAVHHKMTGLMTTISAAGCQLEQSVQRRNWSPSPDDTPGSTPIGESGSLIKHEHGRLQTIRLASMHPAGGGRDHFRVCVERILSPTVDLLIPL
jgi:hypothetical protein